MTKQLYVWHWVSSAIALIGMLFFAVTGITLNHSARMEAKHRIVEKEAWLPDSLRGQIENSSGDAPLPVELVNWLRQNFSVSVTRYKPEWSEADIYISMPRPGGDSWISIDRNDGYVLYEITSRGVIAYMNDLHKGRHTGVAWSWFLDAFSVAAIIFCMTGFFLLLVHAKRRPSTWPLIAAGFLLPFVIIIIFIH
jgi:hypothetical protein